MKDIKEPHKLLNRVIYSFIGVSIALILLATYWLVYPYKPITSEYAEFPILNDHKTLRAGDTIIFLSSTCRNFTGSVLVHRALINDVLLTFSDTTFYQDKEECKEYENRTLRVPYNAPDGVYRLEITSFVRVNPIRVVATKFITEEFRVLNPLLDIDPIDREFITEGLDI